MGYIKHDAIVVTATSPEAALYAHRLATEQGLTVAGPAGTNLNGYLSFLIVPDGSKENAETSDQNDIARQSWKMLVATKNKELFQRISYVHVKYGGDEQELCWIVDHTGKET